MNRIRARLWLSLLAAAVLWNGGWVPSSSATILISRTPMPPSAAVAGQSTVVIGWEIEYSTALRFATVKITAPDASLPFCRYLDYAGNGTAPEGCLYESRVNDKDSPSSGSGVWEPPVSADNGKYVISVEVFDVDNMRSYAESTLYVTNSPALLKLCVFNDVDSDGSRDDGESGLSSWRVRFTVPPPYGTLLSDTFSRTTGTDGCTAAQVSVPAGDYAVSEIVQSGWTMTAPSSTPYALSVPAGQTTEFWFGNHADPTAVVVRKFTATAVHQRSPAVAFTIAASILAGGLWLRRRGCRSGRCRSNRYR